MTFKRPKSRSRALLGLQVGDLRYEIFTSQVMIAVRIITLQRPGRQTQSHADSKTVCATVYTVYRVHVEKMK